MRTTPWLLALAFGFPFHAFACDHGVPLQGALVQLTGAEYRPFERRHEFAETSDPAPPLFLADGSVEIYVNSHFVLRYASFADLASGGCYERLPLHLSGQDEDPWDVRKYLLFENKEASPRELIVGGAMSDSDRATSSLPLLEAFSRRVFLFEPTKQELPSGSPEQIFLQAQHPLVGSPATGWLGHSYGGNFYQPGSSQPNEIHADAGPAAFFYERVSRAENFGPLSTELFVREVDPASLVPSGREIKVLGLPEPVFPAARRIDSDASLIEGGRPLEVSVKGKKFFLLGFSAGDFFSDHYTISYAWSKTLVSEYTPSLRKDGDLEDLGAPLKKKFGLSWVGRPALYRAPDGSYQMLFHGLRKSILPDNDYTGHPDKYGDDDFYRVLFNVPVKVMLRADGSPKLSLSLGK